jgi:hypothetical protein
MSRAAVPNAMGAYVADAKVRGYLLNPSHPSNGGNAGFFNRFGFTQQHCWFPIGPGNQTTASVGAGVFRQPAVSTSTGRRRHHRDVFSRIHRAGGYIFRGSGADDADDRH